MFSPPAGPAPDSFLRGGGTMGDMIRARDWANTEVDAPSAWPQSLKAAVSMLLNCQLPMYLAWGPGLLQFYNDAYRPILGDKHPAALGASAPQTWSEIWATIGPMWEQVLRGEPIGFEDFKLTIDRYGYAEDCYFNFSTARFWPMTGGSTASW
jgi:hypothetical protein